MCTIETFKMDIIIIIINYVVIALISCCSTENPALVIIEVVPGPNWALLSLHK